MTKKLSDYLHFHIGAQCSANDEVFKLCGVEYTDTGTLAYDGTMIDGVHQCWWVENCDFKLHLKPLIHKKFNVMGRDTFRTYLKQDFDVFNLIKAGLAKPL